MALPDLTPEQREQALRKAVAARRERAAALDDLRKGRTGLADVLAAPDSPLRRAKVRQVLCALPRVGPATADKAIAQAGIDPGRRVAGLGVNQRQALTEFFAA